MSDSEGDPENVSNINDPQTASVETGDSDQLAIGGAEEPDERLRRQQDRAKKNESRLLAVQMFTSMCEQITTQTDKNNDFLDALSDSIDKELHNISLSDIEAYLTEVDACVNDVRAIYNELQEMSSGKPDSTQEKTFQEFLDSIETFKASLAANKTEEESLLEEQKKLDEANRVLQERLAQLQTKNKKLKEKMVRTSQVTVTPLPVTPASPSSVGSGVSMRQSETSSNPDKEWIKDFTREITHGIAETLAGKDDKKEEKRKKKSVEPEIFSGNPLEFNDWEIDWKTYVEAEELTEKEALRFIKKYLSGKARDCVIGLLSVNTAEAYRQVLRKLKERFSTDQDIAGIFKKRLRQWPPIKDPDGERLQEFADFLDHIKSSRSSVKGLGSLDEKEQNEYMSQKLPQELKLKWVEIINQRKIAKRNNPSFSDFADFVQVQAATYMNPIMKRHTSSSTGKYNSRPNNENRGFQKQSKSYNTSTNDVPGQKKPYCHFCKNNDHSIPDCKEFAQKTYRDKMAFINTNRLCFRCAKHRGLAKDCRSRIICEICGKQHATVLHNPEHSGNPSTNKPSAAAVTDTSAKVKLSADNPNETSTSKDTASRNSTTKKVKCSSTKRTTYSKVVPVYISAGGREKLVYALMDNGSDSTYIDKQVAKEINATGATEDVQMVTMNAVTDEKLMLYPDLTVRGYMTNNTTMLDAYEKDAINCSTEQIPTYDKCLKLPHLQKVAKHLSPLLDIPIGLLIGADCPQAIYYEESVKGPDNEPFAAKTMFGWTLCGGKSRTPTARKCYMTQTSELSSPTIFKMVENDFSDLDGNPISQDDLLFINILETNTTQDKDGTLVMPLPFKRRPNLPDNRSQALKRLCQIKAKLQRDDSFKTDYCGFMQNLMERGHAEEVPATELETGGECWYIPHFGVKHPKKDKLRVVFDASAKFNSTSLNDWLLKGPDQMNDLLGILLRFRLGKIAITSDVEQMFYNFKVAEKDKDFLRFLWLDDDLETVKTYRMNKHIFGATSSPGVATYGLRRIARHHPSKASDFITRDFYVDDGVTSVDSVEEAITLIREASAICQSGNLRLHKFTSNSAEVLASLPATERAVQDAELFSGNLPTQRTLGMEWNIDTDIFHFVNESTEKPETRRGLLSTVAQIFDPMGLIAPITLCGKNILQETCRQKLDWDDPIGEELSQEWRSWKKDIEDISGIQVGRHIKPDDFSQIGVTELHHFSDASEDGYGTCSYIRMVDVKERVHCSLILAKARVAPLKLSTMPRMELQAAVSATEQNMKLKSELSINIDREYFWCDSTIALGYIKNDTAKFLPYVSNRVSQIRSKSKPQDWYHISGALNPADIASRGSSVKDLMDSCWYTGPKFLWEKDLSQMLENQPNSYDVDPADKEVRKPKVHVKSTALKEKQDSVKVENFSTWASLIRGACQMRMIAKRAKQGLKPIWKYQKMTRDDLMETESFLVRSDQEKHFPEEISALKAGRAISTRSRISQLSPFLDAAGLMRVGSRAAKSSVFTSEETHPRIISKASWLANLIISHHHSKVHHQGRIFTQASLRQSGFWIVGAHCLTKSLIRKCVTCKKMQKTPIAQQMGLLPKDRVDPSPPFTHIGVDTFGHFTVKERRSEIKRWCIVFTCMFSRAIHIEVVNDLSTDSFLQAFQCLESIRGPVSTIYSDNGTNFMGSRSALSHILFKTSTPAASHQGGVWERSIRTIRNVFSKIKGRYTARLDTAALRAAMYEVTKVINCKPLTIDNLDDPDERVITPQHLLTMKHDHLLIPGTDQETTDKDIYGRQMSKKSQQFAKEFSQQWRDYLTKIEIRQKWKNPCDNIKVGDIVAVMDENLARTEWKTGVVEEVKLGTDQLVRSASVRLVTSERISSTTGKRQGNCTILIRPVQKLILILSK